MTSPEQNLRKRCFAPVVDDRTRLLVLGSFPEISRLLRRNTTATSKTVSGI